MRDYSDIDQREAIKQAARACPAGLAVYESGGVWQLRPHLRLVDEALTQAAAVGGTRTIVEMHPRSGKSEICSRYGPAWLVGSHPDRSVLLASYEATFAASWGMKARDVLAEVGPSVFGVRVHPEVSSRDNWKVQRWDGRAWQSCEGGMATAGVGGALTGKGAHLLIIDDPFKNWEEAQSKAHRDRVWDWFRAVAYTRLEPGGSIVLILTRWHEDDLAGRLLSGAGDEDLGREQWDQIKLAALSEGPEVDPMGRPKGEALWPERFSRERLLVIRETLGSLMFEALYQQRPTPEGGSVFFRKHFRYWRWTESGEVLMQHGGQSRRYLPKHLTRQMYVDPALTEKETSDPTVILVGLRTPDNQLLVEEIIRERVESPALKNLIRSTNFRTSPARIGFEGTAFQASVIQDLAAEGLPIVSVPTDSNKHTRAIAASTRVEQGKVWFMADAHWLAEFERELLLFPNATHDDQVDVLAHASADVVGRGAMAPVVRTTAESGEDNVLVVNF